MVPYLMQLFAQDPHRPEVVLFYAAFGAAQHRCRVPNAHTLPLAQYENLSLPLREVVEGLVNPLADLLRQHHFLWLHAGRIEFRAQTRLQQVLFPVVVAAKQRDSLAADFTQFSPAPDVGDAVVEDSEEQWRPFRFRLAAVFLDKLEHGVLNDVKSSLFLMQSVDRNSERLMLDTGQEPIHGIGE